MIKLRTLATAYLMNGDDFLLMKRSINRKFKPGIWAGVGGHLEPHEINDPLNACLREVFEETGIREAEIDRLTLKYIILRRSVDEIRVQYIYFGISKKRETIQTDEGDLHWISRDKLLDREMTATTRISLRHYMDLGGDCDDVLVGTVGVKGDQPVISWHPVQDWE